MNKEKQFPLNVVAEKKDKTAVIRITGFIGFYGNSEALREIVDEKVKEGCTKAHLYINTPGGSCFDAEEIVNILTSSFDEITGEGGALVASAGTYIAAHCKTFEMPKNGKFMVHRPWGGVSGTVAEIMNYAKLLGDIDSEYFELFKSKVTDAKKLKEKWESGDWWMTASEAKKEGFITSVRTAIKIDDATQAMFAACAAPTNFILKETNTSKTKNMDELKMIAPVVGLKENADAAAVRDAVQGIVQQNADLQAENKALQDKVDAIEAAEKQKQQKEAADLVAAAQKDGRTDAEGAKAWLRMFEKDHEAAKASLAAIPTPQSVSERIEKEKQERTPSNAWEKRFAEIENNKNK